MMKYLLPSATRKTRRAWVSKLMVLKIYLVQMEWRQPSTHMQSCKNWKMRMSWLIKNIRSSTRWIRVIGPKDQLIHKIKHIKLLLWLQVK